MDPERLRTGLARFATDLTVAGEAIAFDAVVTRHLDFLIELRATGLRWPGIARLLAAAGACRQDGAAFSADQIRASVSRVRRRPAAASVHPVPASARSDDHFPARPERAPAMPERPPDPAPSTPNQPARRDLCEPDLSDTEIRTARQRMLGP